MDLSPAQQQAMLDIARAAIRDELRGVAPASLPVPADPVFQVPAGCFVTLHQQGNNHRLRGCIGRLQTPDPLHKTLPEVARSAVHDPRFVNNPITLAELPRLDLEISLLSPLQPAANPLDFDLLNDGIYLISSGRAGTFLPQVARETGWTREQLLARLCTEKMGLAANAWQDPQARLLKYRTITIGPVPFDPPPSSQVFEKPAPPQLSKGLGFGPNNTFKI